MAMNNEDRNRHPSVERGDAVHSTDMRETAHALELAIAQIGMSLGDADHAMETLIEAITAIAGCVHRIEQQLDGSYRSTDTAISRESILKECELSKQNMQRAITAFQFYDLLSQRIAHIQENLDAVVEVVRAPDQQHASMWQHLHEKLRSVYSLQQEQTMYKALLGGLSDEYDIKEGNTTEQGSCGDIELF